MSEREMFERCAIEIMANNFSQLEVENDVAFQQLSHTACAAAFALVMEASRWEMPIGQETSE